MLCNFIEIALRHGCSPVNLLNIFRTHFYKNTSEWVLLVLSVLYKIGLVHSFFMLLFRFFKIYSSMENVHIEVKHLRSILKCNNCHVDIIDQCTKTFLDKLYVSKQVVPTVPKGEFFIVLPFLGEFSLNLRKRLCKSVSKSLLQCNIKVIFQSKNRSSSFLKFKGSILLYLRSHLIY